jgi:hypothetical protein
MNDTDHSVVLESQVAAYQDAVRDVVSQLGHEGDDPADLRDAVGQVVDRLLQGQDLTTPLTGAAEVIRLTLVYAHVGAWLMQGLMKRPIQGRVASPELLASINAPPSRELLAQLLRGGDNSTAEVEYVMQFFKLLDPLVSSSTPQ